MAKQPLTATAQPAFSKPIAPGSKAIYSRDGTKVITVAPKHSRSDHDEDMEDDDSDIEYIAGDTVDFEYAKDSPASPVAKSKKKKKKKKKKAQQQSQVEQHEDIHSQPGELRVHRDGNGVTFDNLDFSSPHSIMSAASAAALAAQRLPEKPSSSPSASVKGSKKDDKIWDTSTQEERQRIKEFWASLSELERRDLVRIEKDAMLQKMKEQQRHSCSCKVCGRKRQAIEQELEALYDAYYKDLEVYSDPNLLLGSQQQHPQPQQNQLPELQEPSPDPDNDHNAPPQPSSSSSHQITSHPSQSPQPPNDELLPPEPLGDLTKDLFSFGSSLTIQGGILTVADDLLKNDGKKFIDMMEQLAERRIAREEESLAAPVSEYDDDDDEIYDDDDDNANGFDYDYEDEDLDELDDEDLDDEDDDLSDENDEDDEDDSSITEEQRIQEGRRMLQLFAARMFEQRVLQAYREKVAQERQQKLLEELEEETRLAEEREAKKLKEKERKKDKKRQQKQAKEEERKRREEEKAAAEAAAKAEQERKAEEARKKRLELKAKKEAEKRMQEEERKRKEAEKERKRKEREAEEQRKKREQEEKRKQEEQLRKQEAEERKRRELEEEQRRKEQEAFEAEKERLKREEEELRRREEELRKQQEAALKSKQEHHKQLLQRLQQYTPAPSTPPLQTSPYSSSPSPAVSGPPPGMPTSAPAVSRASPGHIPAAVSASNSMHSSYQHPLTSPHSSAANINASNGPLPSNGRRVSGPLDMHSSLSAFSPQPGQIPQQVPHQLPQMLSQPSPVTQGQVPQVSQVPQVPQGHVPQASQGHVPQQSAHQLWGSSNAFGQYPTTGSTVSSAVGSVGSVGSMGSAVASPINGVDDLARSFSRSMIDDPSTPGSIGSASSGRGSLGRSSGIALGGLFAAKPTGSGFDSWKSGTSSSAASSGIRSDVWGGQRSLVTKEEIRNMAITVYSKQMSQDGGWNLDGYVPAQLLFHATVNNLPTPITQNEFYQACALDQAGPKGDRFESERDNVGLVTRIRYVSSATW